MCIDPANTIIAALVAVTAVSPVEVHPTLQRHIVLPVAATAQPARREATSIDFTCIPKPHDDPNLQGSLQGCTDRRAPCILHGQLPPVLNLISFLRFCPQRMQKATNSADINRYLHNDTLSVGVGGLHFTFTCVSLICTICVTSVHTQAHSYELNYWSRPSQLSWNS